MQTLINDERQTQAQQPSHTKVTRHDWLRVAHDLLVKQGEEAVKIQAIGAQLGVSRSSFYWYFSDRKDLLNALLEHWQEQNTRAFIEQTQIPSATITEAVCRVFYCAIDERLFSTKLDFAVREWGRRSEAVMAQVRQSDRQCLDALTDMYLRFDYGQDDAEIKARMLYFTQVGYHLVDLQESLQKRLRYVRGYLLGFTGQEPLTSELEALGDYIEQLRR